MGLFALLCAMPENAQAQFFNPPPAYVSLIVVGGEGNVPCCKNNGEPIEFQYRNNRTAEIPTPQIEGYPAAALRGSSITIKFTYTCPFDGYLPYDGTIHVDAGGLVGNNFHLSPFSSEQIHLLPGGSQTVTYILDNMPNYVCVSGIHYEFTYHWTYGDYGDADGWGTTFYIVHRTPTNPQAQPWIGVLANACTWAEGDSTDDNISRDLTLGLYYSQRFAYPEDTGSYWTNEGRFKLADFLETTGVQSGNCVDVSDYLTICANALGLYFGIEQLGDSQNRLFHTTPVCPIGSDSTQTSLYDSKTWGFHQIAVPLDENTETQSVYDSCAAQLYDLNHDLFQNPPFKWPLIKATMDSYWQTSQECGLVATPHPSTVTINGPGEVQIIRE